MQNLIRNDRFTLSVVFEGVDIELYTEDAWHIGHAYLDDEILEFSDAQFGRFRDCYVSDFEPVITAFHDLVSAYKCSGSTTLPVNELRSGYADYLLKAGVLLDDEKAAFAKHRAEQLQAESLGSQETFVYLMRDTRTGFHKIGRSRNPQARERTLQSDNPLIEMVGHWPAVQQNERELHACFADKRVRGEWFNLSREDVLLIEQTLSK